MSKVLVAGLLLATAIVSSGCGGSGDSSNSTPTPTPQRTPPHTPRPTPRPTPPGPTPTFGVITIVPSVASPAGFDIGAGTDGFLVAYGTTASGSTSKVNGVRLAANANIIDQTPFLISVAQSGGYLADPSWTEPAVGFDWTTYAVSYAGSGTAQDIPANTVTAVVVDAQASVGAPTDLAETAAFGTCESSVGPPLAIAGTPSANFAAIWRLQEGCVNSPIIDRIDGAFATPAGSGLTVAEIADLLPPIDGTPIVSSGASVASSLNTTVATWTESAEGASDVVVEVALLSASGVERVPLTNPFGSSLVRPAIASDGSDYLVVWQQVAQTIVGARFRPGTGPLDGLGWFIIARDQGVQGEPRLAFGDGAYLVAWTVATDDPSSFDLHTALVSPAGTVTPAETVATGLTSPEVAVAFAGEAFVVAFLGDVDGAEALQGLVIPR